MLEFHIYHSGTHAVQVHVPQTGAGSRIEIS